MTFSATVVADSISTRGHRLLTIEATYPRIIHSELMTHRVFSRNSASTRAIALSTQLRNLLQNPFIPEKFGINQRGMQAMHNLEGAKHEEAVDIWLSGRDRALTTFLELILGREVAGEVLGYESGAEREYASGDLIAQHLDEIVSLIPSTADAFDPAATSLLNVHKQLAGRGLEAYMWHTVVITATEFDNFFALRDHPDAQGEIATIAHLMKQAVKTSQPRLLTHSEWHTPYVNPGEFELIEDAIKASVARAAATSYNRQRNKNLAREPQRYRDLLKSGHMSPFEHQATPLSDVEWRVRGRLSWVLDHTPFDGLDELARQQLINGLQFNGNLRGWMQHRKQIEHEDNFGQL